MKLIEKQGNRKRVATINDQPTRTQQQFKDQVNVNNIMKKYKQTGTITHLRNQQAGVYLDLTEIPDYAESLMKIKHAQAAFEEIPAHIRIKFNNDPQQLINYLSNPENHAEAIHLGLMVKRDDKTKNNDANTPPPAPDAPPTTAQA